MVNRLKTIKIIGISNWNSSTVSQTLAVIDLASRSTVSIVLDFVWLRRQNIANGIYSWALKGLQILQESIPVVYIPPAWKPYVLQRQWPRPDIALGGPKWTSLQWSQPGVNFGGGVPGLMSRGYPAWPFLRRGTLLCDLSHNAFGVTSLWTDRCLWQHYLPAKVFVGDKDTSVKENKEHSI